MAQEAKRVGDVTGGDLFPDLEQRPLADLLGKDLTILDLSVLDTKFGKFAVIKCSMGKEVFTTACGGDVVVRKLQEVKEKGLLPLIGAITKPGRYYDIK